MTGKKTVETAKLNSTDPMYTEDLTPSSVPQGTNDGINNTMQEENDLKRTNNLNKANTTTSKQDCETDDDYSEEEHLPKKKKRWSEEEQHWGVFIFW